MANTNQNGDNRIQELEQELEIERAKYRLISGMVTCGLWEYTVSTGILVQSRLGEGMGEKDRLRIPNFRNNMLASGLIYEEDIPLFETLCRSLQNGDETFSYDIRSYVEPGKTMWLRYEGYTVFNSKGLPARVMGRTVNVDEEKKMEQVTVREADRDSVTGLLTGNAIRERLEDMIKDSSENDRIVFFVLGLDNLSSITDTYGHAYAEYVLEKMAGGLGSVFMASDCIAHTEDGEFIMLKNDIRTPAEVYAIARAVGKAAERIELKRGGSVELNIGVSVFPKDGRDYASLHRKALRAIEESRKNPNNNCTIYDESLEEHQMYRPARKEEEPAEKPEAKKIVEREQQTQYGPVEKNIVGMIFDMLAANGTGDEDLTAIFGEIGKYYGYKRIYAVIIDPEKQLLHLRCNWENGDNPHVKAYEEILRGARRDLRHRFSNDSVFICTDSSQLGINVPDFAILV